MKSNNNKRTSLNDVYSIVTNRIIQHLEKGVIPWRQPWSNTGMPKNLISNKSYRGVNIWLLNSLGYSQNYFLTFKQVKELGGSVNKGEKAQEVIFWKWLERENKETGEKEMVPFLRYYKVFNIAQCSDIPKDKLPPIVENTNNPLETCEKIISEMPKLPEIRFNENSAYYNKKEDYVNMPKMETFKNSESYYSTLFHELVHSTGHSERLNRNELTKSNGFGTENYAIEELTAEMGASYLKSYAGIPIEQLENNAAYIQNWLERLKNDKKLIVYASSQAQKATDFILNIRNEELEPEYANKLIKEQEKVVDRERELKELRISEKDMEVGVER